MEKDRLTSLQIADDSTYLENSGYRIKLLRELHHFDPNVTKITYASAVRYFGKERAIGEKNELFGLRMRYVRERIEQGSKNHRQLTDESLQEYPKI